MPQIDWTPEFKRNTTVEFDRLKLKVGERARIVALEKPHFTWVHTLRAPKIVNGEAHKVIKRRNDGSEFADWDMDFIGRPQCLGDHETISSAGLDPANCPVCAYASESEEASAPDRRFAMNVIKYNTRADGTPISPFGCSAQVWTFTEGIFNKLYAIAQEYGGLVGHDLVLGPCEAPETFQKYPITGGAKNLWESSEDIKKNVLETHQNNRIEDLDAACGRRTEMRWLKEDLTKIRNRWRTAHGDSGASSTETQDLKSLKGELDNLMAPAPVVAEEIPPTSSVQTYGSADDPIPANMSAADVKPESAGGSDPENFSNLLAKLNL